MNTTSFNDSENNKYLQYISLVNGWCHFLKSDWLKEVFGQAWTQNKQATTAYLLLYWQQSVKVEYDKTN